MKNINWPWLILAYLTLFVMGFLDNSRGPAYPLIIESFNISPAAGSWFFSLASFSGLLVLLTARKWLPIVGVVRATKLSLLIMGVGTLCMSFLPSLPHQYFFLLLFAMVFGVGQGLSSYCMNLLVAESASIEYRSRAFSGLHSCYGVASFIAPLIFSFFYDLKGHWSPFFLWMSLIPLFIFFFVFKIGRGVPISKKTPRLSGLKFSKRALYGGVFSFYVASEIVLSSRLVYFLMEARGFTNERASEYLSLFFLSLMGGRLLFATLPMTGRSYKAMICSLILSFFMFFYGYYYNAMALAFVGGTMSFYFPMGMDWLTSRFEVGREEMIASTMTQVGVLLILMHVFFGKLASEVSVEKALLMAPCLIFISFVFLILLRKDNSSGDRPLHQA